MKKFELPVNNRVTFEPESHTYTLDNGKELSGITSIIHKYLFPSMYDGVSEKVLEAARERGHRVHAELELLFKGFPKDMLVRPETQAYIKLAKENKLKQVAAEYLVSDNEHIATCIDSVLKTKDGVALVDYKTTNVIYEENLQWQLSIEAVLFEMQTSKEVTKLYAIHLPKDGDAKMVEIKRLPNEYVYALINAYVNGEETFENPLHQLSDDTHALLEQYKQAELSLIELNASVEYYKQIQADIKAKIKEQMDEESASKWENDYVTITRSKDSTRKTFKPDMLKEYATDEVLQSWLDKVVPMCYTETKINGNVTIKFK